MKNVIALFVLCGLCAMFPVNMFSANVESPSTTQYSSTQRSAEIKKTWITSDKYVEGTLALSIHLDLTVYGCKGRDIRVGAFLYNNDGSSNPLYFRSNYGKIYERYYIGRTNENAKCEGWGVEK